MPATVAAMEAEVASTCADALAEAGVYLRAVEDGVAFTPAIRQGLRMGAKAVGLFLADPLNLTDADAALLSPYAVERVLLWGQWRGLRTALLRWHLAVRRHDDEPLAPAPYAGGWLVEEKRNVERYVAELKAIIDEPYRDPYDPIVVVPGQSGDPGRISTNAVAPIYHLGRGFGWGYPGAGC